MIPVQIVSVLKTYSINWWYDWTEIINKGSGVSSEVMQQEHKASSSAQIRNVWRITSTPPTCLCVVLLRYRYNLTISLCVFL
jgi:hypothetical protein